MGGTTNRLPRWNTDLCPALPVVIVFIAGVLVSIAVVDCPSTVTRAACIVACLSAAVVVAVSTRLPWLPLCFLAGILCCALHLCAPWHTYRASLPRDECNVQIRGIVIDKGYTGEALPWLHSKSGWRVLVREVRTNDVAPWIPCRGKMLLRFPQGSPPQYGSVIDAQGALNLPHPPLFDGDFDYAHYLRAQGIVHILHAKTCDTVSGSTNWHRFPAALFRWRDRCVELLVRGLRTDAGGALLAAMTLGYRQGLDPHTRNTFLRSGAIHIFAISGLHAGIVGTLMLLSLRFAWVPYRARYLLLPFLLGAYVYVTGGAPSAVRAWVMFSLWSLTKAFLMPNSPVNTVALAALVLLVVNPLNVTQTGFQFSFAIVLLLIMGWRFCSPYLTAVNETDYWVPRASRRLRVWSLCRRRLLDAACASLLAWFAGAGLIAWTNSLVIPAALPVNGAISLLVLVCLCAGIAKVACGILLLAWPERAIAWFLDIVLRSMRGLAEWGSEFPGSIAVVRPSSWLVLIYYAVLAFVLLPRIGPRKRLAAACASCSLVLVFAIGPLSHPRHLAIFHGNGNTTPAVVITQGRGRPAIVVNTGGAGIATSAATWLRSRGCNELDALVVTDGAWENVGGAEELLAACPARTVVVPAGSDWLMNKLRPIEDAQRTSGRRVRVLQSPTMDRDSPRRCAFGTLEIQSKKPEWRLETFAIETENADGTAQCAWESDARSGTDVTWSSGDASRRIHLPISLRRRLTVLHKYSAR